MDNEFYKELMKQLKEQEAEMREKIGIESALAVQAIRMALVNTHIKFIESQNKE